MNVYYMIPMLILAVLVGWLTFNGSATANSNQATATKKTDYSISYVLTATEFTIQKDCLPVVLDSILASTVLPDEIVVVVTGMTSGSPLLAHLKKYQSNNLFRFYYLRDQLPYADAKNYGAKMSRSDLITFFSTSDTVSPIRTEFLKLAFLTYPDMDFMVHANATAPRTSIQKMPTDSVRQLVQSSRAAVSYFDILKGYTDWINARKGLHRATCCLQNNMAVYPVAWVTMKRRVWIGVKYSHNWPNYEDTAYTAVSALAGFQMGIFTSELADRNPTHESEMCSVKLA